MRDAKTLTLRGYHDKYGDNKAASLYVVNTSDGRIAFTCRGEVSGTTNIIIPISFAPTDLTAFSERDNVLSNPSFRKFLNAGMLVIVDNDDFEDMLENDNELREEYNSVNDVIENKKQDTVQIDLNRDKKQEQHDGQFADNEEACSNNHLASIVQECQLLDNDNDGSRLRGLTKSLTKKMNTYKKHELEEFVKVCPSQELRELAITRINYLEQKESENN